MDKKGVVANAFKDDSSITSVKFGENCHFVEDYAFYNCKNLNEIYADNILEYIGEYAFSETNLNSVNLEYLTTLADGVFSKCSNLSSVDIPICENIGDRAFYNCSNLSNISLDNCLNIWSEAFRFCKKLNISNLNKCEYIGKYAFNDCENIKQITLKKCTDIGEGAFYNCKNLNRVYIYTSDVVCKLADKNVFCSDNKTPDNQGYNTYFYVYADKYNDYINDENWGYYENFIIPIIKDNQIAYIADQKAELDEGINNSIFKHSYNENKKYGLIEFKNDIKSLNFNIFKDSSKTLISSIELPSSCETIGNNVFDGYEKLEHINLPASLNKIGDYAFKDCKSFTSFTIPESVNILGEGIFAGCENITKFTGKFSTYGGNAIVYDGKLISIVPINDNVTYGRFFNISDIDKNITAIGKSCFYGCKELRRVNIPSYVSKIGDNAFKNCINLCEVHFDRINTPQIGENIFEEVREDSEKFKKDLKIFVPEISLLRYCRPMENYINNIYPKPNENSIIYYAEDRLSIYHKQVTNENIVNANYYVITNVNEIVEKNYFRGKNITSVILNDNIKRIDEFAFEGCTKMEYIYLPDSITKLDNRCFYGCKSLTKIHIPSGLNNPSEYITPNINPLIVPKYETKIQFGKEIFVGCKGLREFGSYISGLVINDNRCYIHNKFTLNFFAQSGALKCDIPGHITTINESAFRGSNIKTINFTNETKLTTIGTNAFNGCKDLEKISLPNTLTTISDYAFNGCEKLVLEGDNCLNTVTQIGICAFAGCSLLTKVNINNNITTINESAFSLCEKLTDVEINTADSKLENINANAFNECSSLRNINLPENLKQIGEYAFNECSSLRNINLPEKLTHIGKYAFKNAFDDTNDNITISIPDSVETLGASCFESSQINKLVISKNSNLTNIPENAFKDCKSLKNVSITSEQDFFTRIENGAFNGCSSLANDILSLPLYIKYIGSKAFFNCVNITEISLRDKVEYINDSAFDRCSITKVNIPKSVTKLGNNCFNGIEFVYMNSMYPPEFYAEGNKMESFKDLSSYPFGGGQLNMGTTLDIEIYVPNIYYNNYMKDGSIWKTIYGEYTIRS